MLSLTTANPLEIILNPFQDGFGFAFWKTPSQPFEWIAVVLLVVATVRTMTCWNDIVRCISATFGEWNEMILCQFMPQPGHSSAIGATAVEVVETALPVGSGERIRQLSFGRSAPLIITSAACARLVGVGFVPSPPQCSLMFWVGKSPCLLFFVCFIWIGFSIALIAFVRRWKVFVAVFSVVVRNMFSFPGTPKSRRCATAFRALGTKVIFGSFVWSEIFTGWRKVLAAFATPLKGEGDIKHSNLSSLLLDSGMGTALRLAVVRRVINPPQAQEYYSTESGVLIWR